MTLPEKSASIRLFSVPVFENPKLQIYGKPDAIDTAQGALIPVEVKSHKSVERSDELELAFYWILLEPYRTRAISPRGFLLLRRDGTDQQVEVEIQPHRLERVRTLLQGIRDAHSPLGVRFLALDLEYEPEKAIGSSERV